MAILDEINVNGTLYKMQDSAAARAANTYTKGEVDALVAAIKQFVPVAAQTLPTASADTMYKLYLIPSEDPQEGNIKDEYITIDNGASANPRYTWEKIGSTDIDISGKADISTVPTDVTRTQTDATFVNSNHGSLFNLRQATSSLAGLMTAAEHTKLGALPTAQDLNTRLEGTIYDISVLHPTSGVSGGNTYASLSAALAVIPQDKRKGGMTVRYVYSYDNNYIQYRCMAQNFTTDVTQWQGVDDEPTAGSLNLVKSGGCFDTTIIPIESINYNLGSDSKTVICNEKDANEWYPQYNIPVKKGDVIKYNDFKGFIYMSSPVNLIVFQETFSVDTPFQGDVLLKTPNSYTNELLSGICSIQKDGIINIRSRKQNSNISITSGNVIEKMKSAIGKYEYLNSGYCRLNEQYPTYRCPLPLEKGTYRIEVYMPLVDGVSCRLFIRNDRNVLLRLGDVVLDGTNQVFYASIDEYATQVVFSFDNISDYGYATVRIFKATEFEQSESVVFSTKEFTLIDKFSSSSNRQYPNAEHIYIPIGKNKVSIKMPLATGYYASSVAIKVNSNTTYKKIYDNIPYDGETHDIEFDNDVVCTEIIIENTETTDKGIINFELYHKETCDVLFKGDIANIDKVKDEIPLSSDAEYADWISAWYLPVFKGDIIEYNNFKGIPNTEVNIISFDTELFPLKWHVQYALVRYTQVGSETASGSIEIPNDGYICIRTIKDTGLVQTAHIIHKRQTTFYRNVTVAAVDSLSRNKLSADYVCNGINDELTIQRAVDFLSLNGGGSITLFNGTYNIDSFPHTTTDGNVAILMPTDKTVEIKILGESRPYTVHETIKYGGVHIKVTASMYETMEENERYIVIGTTPIGSTISSKLSLMLQDFYITFPSNQKITQGIDLLWANRVDLQRISIYNYRNGYNGQSIGVSNPPQVANSNSVGIKFTGGSNHGTSGNDYRNVSVYGFGEGFKIGGEHVLMVHCAAFFCIYGYTFGNYAWTNAALHPINLIGCTDERNINLPLFVDNGTHDYNIDGKQSVYMENFSIERVASATPGGDLGDLAKEVHPGRFRGIISYGVQSNFSSTAVREVNELFWQDGSGRGVQTTNTAHKPSGTTSERNSYAPNYMQHFFDETLNKELIYNGTKWVDCLGNDAD